MDERTKTAVDRLSRGPWASATFARGSARLVAATLLLGHSATLGAQTPGREPAVVELPSSTRAMALGGAYQLGANDVDLLFGNPALLQRARGMSLGVHVLGGASLAATLATAVEGFGGGVGAGLQVMEHRRSAPEALSGARSGGLDPFLREGVIGVSELAATLGYGRNLFGTRVGVAAKLVDQRIQSHRDASWALDLGVSRDLEGFTLGVALQDLGADLDVNGPADLPTRVTVGAGRYGYPLGPLDLGAAAAVTLRDDGEVVPGGGIELGYYPVTGRTFVARVGARRVPEGEALPLTFGGAYWGDNLVLEYAFQAVDGEDGVHRVSVGWR